MGKKKSSKLKTKAKTKAPLTRQELISRGNRAREFASVPPAALAFTRGDGGGASAAAASSSLTISFDVNPRALAPQAKAAVFALLEANMRRLYESNWDWNPEEKRAELFGPTSRLLLVHAEDGEVVAFSHFRFEADDDGTRGFSFAPSSAAHPLYLTGLMRMLPPFFSLTHAYPQMNHGTLCCTSTNCRSERVAGASVSASTS